MSGFEVKWSVSKGRKMEIVWKQKEFKTEAAREKFMDKLAADDNVFEVQTRDPLPETK